MQPTQSPGQLFWLLAIKVGWLLAQQFLPTPFPPSAYLPECISGPGQQTSSLSDHWALGTVPGSQRGAGRGQGPSWGLCPSSHLFSRTAVGPAAVSLCSSPWHLACTFWALSMVAASFSAPRQEATAGPCDWPRSPSPPPPPAPRQAPQARASRPVASLGSRAAHPLSLLGQSRGWSRCGAWAGPAVLRKPEGLSPRQPAEGAAGP